MTSTEFSFITARSRRQAMDWSLVLLSQGIECTVERHEIGWVLSVEPFWSKQAVEAIRHYEAENRTRNWGQRFSLPQVDFHLGATIWCLVVALFYWLSTTTFPKMTAFGMMDSQAVQNGAWWRLFTAISLHGDIGHLMANITVGFAVFGLGMARFGIGCALLTSYLAGAGGNLAGWLLRHDAYVGLGASGMVMGGLGMLTVQLIPLRHKNPKTWKYAGSGILGGFMLFVLLGLDPRSDIIAHLGGFGAGLVLGGALAYVPQRLLLTRSVNVGTTMVLILLIGSTWALAWQNASPSP